jgi:uncharacterized Zn finger protein
LSPAPFRKQVREALRGLHRRGSYDYGMVGAIVSEIGGVAEEARPYVDAGDGRNALVILGAVAEEYLDAVEELDDSDGEVSALCDDLGGLLTEALLSAELTPREQQEWAQRIEGWQSKAADYGMEDSFEAARYAALQGWSYPPLERVLRGEITERGAWEDEPPDCAGALAEARLNVLQRQGRTQEYLHLARAERQTERYVTMLVRLGRIPEAVEHGTKYVANRAEALALAQALEECGATDEALRIGEHGLTLPEATTYASTTLAEWVRDLGKRVGQTARALDAALIAAREHTNLENYKAVQELAGERWPALREELLARVRQERAYYPSDQVDIFLHEGLLEEAMAVVDANPRHALVDRVANAALPTHPDWVFRACCHQFDRIADAGKSTYYREAVQWLERARAALVAAGREAEWRAYLTDVLGRHARKHSLRPMLERLRRGVA